jgi:hypothetical protein
MSGWRTDKAWADDFTRKLKMVLGVILFREGTPDEDAKRATDLQILEVKAKSIGLRVRNFAEYRPRYAGEFTIRAHRDSGARTEWQKVTEDGLCDLLLYAWVIRAEKRIVSWVAVDLDVLRALVREGQLTTPSNIPNGDGTYFKAISTLKYPSLVFCKSESSFGRELEAEELRRSRQAQR